jgi:hypothetical protein
MQYFQAEIDGIDFAVEYKKIIDEITPKEGTMDGKETDTLSTFVGPHAEKEFIEKRLKELEEALKNECNLH